MPSLKCKQTKFTLKEIIDAAKKKLNQSQLARKMSKKWGVKIEKMTVKGILSKKNAIKVAIKVGILLKCKKLKLAQHSKLDGGVQAV